MDYRHLYYFIKVAELQNMTKAAEELIMTQPALSRVIRNLETEMECTFFERNGKTIRLNRNGEIFLNYARQAFELLEKTKQQLRPDENSPSGLTVIMKASISLMPVLVNSFKELYPDTELRIFRTTETGKSSRLADFIIDVETQYSEQNNKEILLEESSRLLVSRKMRSELPDNFKLSDFRDKTFFVLPGSMQKEITEIACQNAGFSGKISEDSVSSETINSFIEASLGVAIVGGVTWNYASHPGLVMLDLPLVTRKRYIFLKSMTMDKSAAPQFRQFCRDFFAELEKAGDFNTFLKLKMREEYEQS